MEIQLWREILNPYELAVKELTVKFEHLIIEHRQRGLYSPIEQVHSRVKSISSILDKAQKPSVPCLQCGLCAAVHHQPSNLCSVIGIRFLPDEGMDPV